VSQRPLGVIGVGPTCLKVSLVGGQRAFEGEWLARVLDLAAAADERARRVDRLRVAEDLFAVGPLMVVGDPELLEPFAAWPSVARIDQVPALSFLR
jgi:hypothetical protein